MGHITLSILAFFLGISSWSFISEPAGIALIPRSALLAQASAPAVAGVEAPSGGNQTCVNQNTANHEQGKTHVPLQDVECDDTEATLRTKGRCELKDGKPTCRAMEFQQRDSATDPWPSEWTQLGNEPAYGQYPAQSSGGESLPSPVTSLGGLGTDLAGIFGAFGGPTPTSYGSAGPDLSNPYEPINPNDEYLNPAQPTLENPQLIPAPGPSSSIEPGPAIPTIPPMNAEATRYMTPNEYPNAPPPVPYEEVAQVTPEAGPNGSFTTSGGPDIAKLSPTNESSALDGLSDVFERIGNGASEAVTNAWDKLFGGGGGGETPNATIASNDQNPVTRDVFGLPEVGAAKPGEGISASNPTTNELVTNSAGGVVSNDSLIPVSGETGKPDAPVQLASDVNNPIIRPLNDIEKAILRAQNPDMPRYDFDYMVRHAGYNIESGKYSFEAYPFSERTGDTALSTLSGVPGPYSEALHIQFMQDLGYSDQQIQQELAKVDEMPGETLETKQSWYCAFSMRAACQWNIADNSSTVAPRLIASPSTFASEMKYLPGATLPQPQMVWPFSI